MTKDQAKQLYDSGFWADLDHEGRALFQLQEPLLCMPFGVFHEAVEKWMGRPVWTHEFTMPDVLLREGLGELPTPTMEGILRKLPPKFRDKAMIIVTGDQSEEGHDRDADQGKV